MGGSPEHVVISKNRHHNYLSNVIVDENRKDLKPLHVVLQWLSSLKTTMTTRLRGSVAGRRTRGTFPSRTMHLLQLPRGQTLPPLDRERAITVMLLVRVSPAEWLHEGHPRLRKPINF
jgi:hypothetical protein